MRYRMLNQGSTGSGNAIQGKGENGKSGFSSGVEEMRWQLLLIVQTVLIVHNLLSIHIVLVFNGECVVCRREAVGSGR